MNEQEIAKAASENWMRAWAKEHLTHEYGEYVQSDDQAYEYAIRTGHDLHIGSFDDARDTIDDIWWFHWSVITGQPPKSEDYVSCAC